MTNDIRHTVHLSRIQLELMDAIDDNGGVECEQVPDIFFPEDFGRTDATKPRVTYFEQKSMAEKTAREICMRCPVMNLCLKVGLHEDHGIWGGTTPKQRSQIRRTYDL